MIDDAFVRDKLADLSCYLQDLQQVAAHSLNEYTNNLFVKRTGERTIELIVECAVDINNHFILEIGSATPSEYFQSFLDMASLGVISESLAHELAPTAGLRNRLAHEYETVVDRIVYNAIHRIITNYARYINQIQEWLSGHKNGT
ncbi:DUF86 domain-containing protein [bacterium]|nr:DUF86 domain-containing protein [bacterium]